MNTVFNAARYILNKMEPMSAMKLQKLVYYSQAWSLVWFGEPLFNEKIEAWANGPVIRELYSMHRGQFHVLSKDLAGLGDARKLKADQIKTIEAVLKFYGDKLPHELSTLTHLEKPWLNAREGLAPGTRGNVEITHTSMENYYSSLG